MSDLVIRDLFGEVYLLAPANRRPESAHDLEPLSGTFAQWVLRNCVLDETTVARFLQGAETSGVRPMVRPESHALDDLVSQLGAGEGGRFVLWRVFEDRPKIDSFDQEEEVPLLSELADEPVDDPEVWYEVEVVDEAGEPIAGIDLLFSVTGATETKTTDGSGKARLDVKGGSFGSVSFVAPAKVREEVEPRWESLRPLAEIADKPFTRRSVLDLAGNIGIESKVTHVVVVEPPLGKIYMELRDRTGRVALADAAYTIEGPQTLEGRTDADGRLLHERVLPGDYTLTVTVEIRTREDAEPEVDDYETPVVVLEPGDAQPQVRCLAAVPRVSLARLRGLLFDTNKTFLLPTAIAAMRRVRDLWEQLDPAELVIVGHTDTTGDPAVNDPLSEDRAKSVEAYLRDDVDAWLAYYDAAGAQRWGGREDRLMISHMPGFAAREPGEDLVRWFQRTRELTVDGKAGPNTRRALVTEYMTLDGPPLEDLPDFHLSITTLGCGENFPLAEDGEQLDEAPADDREDQADRRAELFFFDTEFGVLPAVGAPDGPEYLDWRARAEIIEDALIEGLGNEVEILELHDALFRTDSAVVLPEAEAPDDDAHASLSSVGLFAQLLRFNQEHPGRKLLIAGHTDTSGGEAHNQTLSEERARCALALLTGDREAFVEIVDARHKVADYKQILSWCTAAFGDREVGDGGFDCDPGTIDDNAFTGIEPLKKFQAQYNANRDAIGAGGQPELAVDGAIGPMTWGGLFDAYQFGIAEELGEEPDGVASLREGLEFLREGDEALGFGEHHPIDQPHRDSFRSQTNRRVEVLLFDSTAEVDLDLAKSNPDISEIYLPGVYRRRPIEPLVSAKAWRAKWDRPTEPAQHQRPRSMIIDAPGCPEGTPFSFEIHAKVDEGKLEPIATVEGVSEEGRVALPFDGWAQVVTDPDPDKELGEELPQAVFSFVATGGGREVESKTLGYADTLDVTFTHAETEEPCAHAEWFVLTSWGLLTGVTDEDGRVLVEGLPPGGARAVMPDIDAQGESNG